MSAIDKMVEAMIRVSGLDVASVKETITTRVKNFEDGVKTVETSLLHIHQKQANIEHNIKIIMEHLALEWRDAPPITPPVIEGTAQKP